MRQTMADMAPLVFSLRDGKIYRLSDWQLCISVSGDLLGSAVEGNLRGVSVDGYGDPDGRMHFRSITFTCENGSATYDFVDQDDYAHRRDVWDGDLRSAVESVMETPPA